MKIPASTDLKEIQQSFRELWDAVQSLTDRNIDMKGKRIINAGASVSKADYVTKSELDSLQITIMDTINRL